MSLPVKSTVDKKDTVPDTSLCASRSSFLFSMLRTDYADSMSSLITRFAYFFGAMSINSDTFMIRNLQ